MFNAPNIKILQRFRLVVTAVIIVTGISTLAMMIFQTAAYGTQDEDCGSEHSASIDGTKECIGEGECKSYEFDGKEVKHCDY